MGRGGRTESVVAPALVRFKKIESQSFVSFTKVKEEKQQAAQDDDDDDNVKVSNPKTVLTSVYCTHEGRELFLRGCKMCFSMLSRSPRRIFEYFSTL